MISDPSVYEKMALVAVRLGSFRMQHCGVAPCVCGNCGCKRIKFIVRQASELPGQYQLMASPDEGVRRRLRYAKSLQHDATSTVCLVKALYSASGSISRVNWGLSMG